MTVNFRSDPIKPGIYSNNISEKEPRSKRIDGKTAYLKINKMHPKPKAPEINPKREDLKKNILITAITIPVVLSGGYLSAIRGAERKFFVDSAQTSKKYFRPIISELKDKIGKVTIKTEDNLKLKCWDINPNNAQKYVLVCHGVGQNLNDCQELYSALNRKGYGVFALEYRGYADNPGTISEHGVYKDADAALKYLKDKGIKEEKIGVVGYSLGGAVATDLSSRNNLGFTVLTSTFNNAKELSKNSVNYLELKLPKRMKKAIDDFPEKFIPLKNSYQSDKKIGKINSPIAIIHSQNDKGIPISLAKKLAKQANNAVSVDFVSLDSGDHWLDKDKIAAIAKLAEKFDL